MKVHSNHYTIILQGGGAWQQGPKSVRAGMGYGL